MTKQRRDREKQQIRLAILHAAREIAAEEGWGAVSIRRIADRIEYAPPIVYQHFADKDAVLIALLLEGFRELYAALQASKAEKDETGHTLIVRLGLAYWDYARQYPEMYEVMHNLGGVRIAKWDRDGKPPELLAVIEFICAAILEWAGPRPLPYPILDCFHILWSALHGLVALNLADRIIGGADYGRILIAQSVETILRGFEAGPNNVP